jgi:hypothetical protein
MIERAIMRYYGEVLFDEPAMSNPPAAKGSVTGKYKAITPDQGTPQQRFQRGQTGPLAGTKHDQEIRSLQERISQLEALVSRDEDVLRKVLGLLVDKGIATREEILERLG